MWENYGKKIRRNEKNVNSHEPLKNLNFNLALFNYYYFIMEKKQAELIKSLEAEKAKLEEHRAALVEKINLERGGEATGGPL